MNSYRRRRWQVGAPLVVLAALSAGCAEAPEPEERVTADRDRARVEGEIDRVYETFSRAYARADVGMLMDSVYGDSAFYLPPGSPVLHGQDRFRGEFSFLERYTRAGGPGPDLTFESVERDYAGDLAYDIGVYTLTLPDRPGAAGVSRGTFLVVWKRGEDGHWRIRAHALTPLE